MVNWFNHMYPYTNVHELNLDWIINSMKDLIKDYGEFKDYMTKGWDDIRDDWSTMRQYILDFFENLDLQAEVNIRLDEMAQDGTLGRCLPLPTQLEKELWFKEKFFITAPEGYYPQGSYYIEGVDGGDDFLIIAFLTLDGSEQVKLRKYNMTTETLLNEIDGDFGHANGLCYNPDNDNIYIARGGGNALNQNYIDVVKFSNFERKDPIALDYKTTSIYYFNHEYYCQSDKATHTLWIYDEDFNLTRTLDINIGTNYLQSFCVTQEFIYVISFRGRTSAGIDGIMVFSHRGEFYGFVPALHSIEIEDITPMSNGFFKCCAYTGGGCLIYDAKVRQNGTKISNYEGTKYYRVQTSVTTRTMTVDTTYTGLSIDGSASHPYPNLTCAIQCAYYKGYTDITINIKGNIPDMTFADLGPIRYLTINGSEGSTVSRVVIRNCARVTLNNLNVVTGSDESGISLQSCNAILNNVSIDTTGYCIDSAFANISLEGTCEFKNGSYGMNCTRMSLVEFNGDITFTNITGSRLRMTGGSTINVNSRAIPYGNIINNSSLTELTGNILLSEYDDLDNIRVAGTYRADTSIVNTLSNCPVSNTNIYIKATYLVSNLNLHYELVSSNHKKFERDFIGGVLSPWKEVEYYEMSEITSGDLNDYKGRGEYFALTESVVNISNVPVNRSFHLFVDYIVSTNNVSQVMFVSDNTIYTRMYYDGNWTAWKRLLNDSEYLPTGITSGDLDDYKTVGEYCVLSDNLANVSNLPVNKPCHLSVKYLFTTQSCTQTVVTYDNVTYTRNYYNNSWTTWTELAIVT